MRERLRRPTMLDVGVGVALAALMLTELATAHFGGGQTGPPPGPVVVHVLTMLTLAAMVALRRTLGVWAAVITMVAAAVEMAVGFVNSAGALIAFLAITGAAAALPKPADRNIGVLCTAVGYTLILLRDPGNTDVVSALPGVALYLGAVAVGTLVRHRNLRHEAAADRVAQVEAARERDITAAAEHERARIARELHDVIAHSLSVIAVQAGAARLDAPPPWQGRFETLESTARAAMHEMRRLLGVIQRRPDLPPDTRSQQPPLPQPGLADLPTLVGQMREAGIDVTVDVQGRPQALAAGQDLAAYRIIQEALTNTLRHANAHHAQVSIRYGVGELDLQIADDGCGRDAAPDTGRGLIGMAERAALYGGHMHAANRPDGHGFHVHATLRQDNTAP